MKPRRMLVFLAVLLLTSCGILELSVEQPTTTPLPANPTQIMATSPSPATQLPTATAPAEVSDPPSPSDTSPVEISDPLPPADVPTEPPATDTPAGPQMVKIYLIAVGDNGVSGDLVGCGDSAVPVQVEITPTQGVLKAALLSLLSLKSREYGESGLYNVFYQSSLQLDSVKIENGTAIIHLSGSLLLGGECDNPRVEAQLTKTALQFSTVQQVTIFINNKPLKDVLSLK